MVPVAAALFFAHVAALAGVAVVSWNRTRPIRRGRAGPAPRPPVGGRTSWTTWLAAGAGSSATLWGAAGSLAHPRVVLAALSLGGAFVATAGVAGRVAAVRTDGRGLRVIRRAGPRFEVPWSSCLRLVPPRTPWGGWRIVAAGRAGTLMPSDLLGMESVLDAVISAAGLSFDGRGWTRGRMDRCGRQPKVMVPNIWVGWTSQWKKYVPGGGAASV